MKEKILDKHPGHLGNNVKRIREIMGMKQYVLADACSWTQQHMSRLENSESIDHEHLEIIANGLGVTPEFIKNFKEEKAVFHIVNNYDNGHVSNNGGINNYFPKTLGKLFQQVLQNEQEKSKTIMELSKVVQDIAEKVKILESKSK